MPKRNYQFEKRQREIAKKEQRQQKKLRQLEREVEPAASEDGDSAPADSPPSE